MTKEKGALNRTITKRFLGDLGAFVGDLRMQNDSVSKLVEHEFPNSQASTQAFGSNRVFTNSNPILHNTGW